MVLHYRAILLGKSKNLAGVKDNLESVIFVEASIISTEIVLLFIHGIFHENSSCFQCFVLNGD